MSKCWFHLLLLLVWIAIGASLRFTQLTGKSPWTDEFATLVFSLGNSYKTVPLNQAISLDTLLQPLQLNDSAGASAVIHHLITEDHHPPLYFVLAHWWMQLFPVSGEYVSLWIARSLPALLGVASIPAIYGLGFLAFRCSQIAQLAAAMMAVSPFGIYLAQEARHYTLGILWVIASLCCLVVAVQHLQRRKPMPIWVVLCWVVVNSLGIATHYFFSLTLCAEALVLIGFGFWYFKSEIRHRVFHSSVSLGEIPCLRPWWRIGAATVGTFVGSLVWVPVWQASHNSQMTQWIMSGVSTGDKGSVLSNTLALLSPVFQALAAWITMVSLLPVEASSLLVVIASGVVMLVFFMWAIPIFYRNLKTLLEQSDTNLATRVLGGFVLSAIAIFFSITYFLGTDLTRGARYNFVYFPGVIVLVGAMLAMSWNAAKALNSPELIEENYLKTNPHKPPHYKSLSKSKSSPLTPPTPLAKGGGQGKAFILGRLRGDNGGSQNQKLKTNGQRAVTLILLMGLLSGITVVSNLGYQKYYRPDLLVPEMQQTSSVPILIATTHNTLVQTGEMMGLAWEFKHTTAQKSSLNPRFLLAHQQQQECVTTCAASVTLQQTLTQLPRPIDLWLVNFKAPVDEPPNCFTEDSSQYLREVDGYATKLYHCLAPDSQAASATSAE